MTKNRTPTPVYLDPGMHPGLEVKGLSPAPVVTAVIVLTYFSWTHVVVYFLAGGNAREQGCFVKYNHKG